MAKIDYLQVRFKLVDPINGGKSEEIVFDHVKNIRFEEHATTIAESRLPEELIITVPQGTLELLPEWLVSFYKPRMEYDNIGTAQFDSELYDLSFSFKTTMIDDLDVRIISGGKK